jgi:alpha-maltose-1-phosphate synthase
MLHAFVSGFSRFGPHASIPDLGNRVVRADWIQNVYLASLRMKLPAVLSDELAYLAKLEQDQRCRRWLKSADLFLFYNGCGLNSLRSFRKHGGVNVVEVVNSHVGYQEELLKEEYDLIGLPWRPFHKAEFLRRNEEYEESDYIVVPSEFSKKSFLKSGFPEGKLIKVNYGFESRCYAREDGSVNADSLHVLFVGSISVRKGLRYLIQAFEKLDCAQKKLTIVGPFTSPSGLENISIPVGVTFTGILRNEELKQAYSDADVLCLPTIEDGFGLVIGEALSSGLPVIATTNSGGPDVISEGVDGFIVPIRSADAIALKLQLLADDKDRLLAMKRSAQIKAGTLSGWEQTQDCLIENLSNLVRHKS